jgi:hypothetical protein
MQLRRKFTAPSRPSFGQTLRTPKKEALMTYRTVTALLGGLGLAALLLIQPPAQSQQPTPAADGPEVLARGPVHEGYAEPIDPRPEASPVVPKQPPEPVEETPPDQRPEGDNVQWVNGYWAGRRASDFVWVSGFGVPPPGRRWVPGHWQQVDGGWQWSPGIWAAAEQPEIEYAATAADHRIGAFGAVARVRPRLHARLLGHSSQPLRLATRLLGRVPAGLVWCRRTTSGRRAAASSAMATGTTRFATAACCSRRCASRGGPSWQ